MESSKSKGLSALYFSMSAYFMSENDTSRTCRYLSSWKKITDNNPELQLPLWGTLQLEKFV